ncbi:MAG: hypothetical protein EPO68_00420 [Planctomycetota bacterium]|nr:MAG: hypothetical protein EPO68_00420 [Planctomycetota bacterium]
MGSRARIAAAAASTCASLLVAWALWPERGAALEVVDHSRELDALLVARAAQPNAAQPSASTDGTHSDAGLRVRRAPIDEPTLRLLFPHSWVAEHEPDPHALFRWKASQSRRVPFPELPSRGYQFTTDVHGLRRASDARLAAGGVLVVGDSHTDGFLDAEQSFCARLELALRSTGAGAWPEVWNAGVLGYCPYNYLGAIEARAAAKPAVVVVV